MDSTGDGHGRILAAVDAYELPLGRYARRLLTDSAAADARAHVAEVRATAAALKAIRGDGIPARSADQRRAVLAAAVGRGAVMPAAPRRAGGVGKWGLALGSYAAVALLATGLFPPAMRFQYEGPRQVAIARNREGRLRIERILADCSDVFANQMGWAKGVGERSRSLWPLRPSATIRRTAKRRLLPPPSRRLT